MCDEPLRQRLLFVERAHHELLLNPDQTAIGQRDGGRYACRLAREASLAKELASIQNGDDAFLALCRRHSEFHFATLQVEHRVRRIALLVYVSARAVFDNGL